MISLTSQVPRFKSLCLLLVQGSPGGSVVKNLPANKREIVLISGPGIAPKEGNGNPFQYSCLEIPWTVEPGRL